MKNEVEIKMDIQVLINWKGLLSNYMSANNEQKEYIRKNYNNILRDNSIVIW